MKTTRKLLAMVLAVMMVMSLATTAFAASGTNTNDGKITIDNAVDGIGYSIYQILKLESYDTEAKAYTYKAASETWNNWLQTQTTYVTVDAQGYVAWNGDADQAAFAKAALAFAEENKIKAIDTKVAEGATVEFTDLNLGYYLVNSSLGTLCSLDTTDKEVTIKEKNTAPTQEKTVKGDDGNWGDTNTATIGDKVEYKVEITAKKGATGYILHDKMEAGLTFNNDVVVKVGDTALTVGTDYTVSTTNTDSCTFEVIFKQTYLDTITADTTIVVTYSATLNENAEIATDSNDNSSKLQYGESVDIDGDGNPDNPPPETPEDTTTTYTYKFDLVKTDDSNKLLTGAEFELYESDQETKIDLVKVDDNTYRVAKDGETGTTTTIVVADGDVTIQGLGNGTYYLKETKAPAGYNLLTGFTEVKINGANLDATITDGAYTSGGIQVINQSGSELPSTGGMGTTLFYVFGAIMMVGAAVLLVTKKRMASAE